ncbi:MAG: response regulator, partial [Nitrospirae bacterium]|nr:response regulator [Nitrospirota bacterium]
MNLLNFLLISKDPEIRRLLEAAAPPHTTIHTAPTISEGLRLWQETCPALMICEGSPHALAPLLESVRQTPTSPPILAIGERHSVKDAVEIMRAGASDYLTKPILLQDLRTSITQLVQHPMPAVAPDSPRDRFTQIISISPQMNLMKQLAKEVALTEATVLITGESGTGK